ncbi:hypothetical protein NLG97_g7559 [Lecanicillium saksenae]|uniref:Uncharacterized protein n=1 Tax=Lecanicillium saksenae TaxID=468837 RepID=A0ACC1QQA9_9HYPO|nr:hypothetical protein NLG97_g7559 [Lecanicillium saksenae]
MSSPIRRMFMKGPTELSEERPNVFGEAQATFVKPRTFRRESTAQDGGLMKEFAIVFESWPTVISEMRKALIDSPASCGSVQPKEKEKEEEDEKSSPGGCCWSGEAKDTSVCFDCVA